jgi:hypothetical protein
MTRYLNNLLTFPKMDTLLVSITAVQCKSYALGT